MAEAIFVPDGDAFVPTDLAGSPWGPGLLHGGPPAGLVARAVERHIAGDPEMQPVRLTLDLFRPVPKEALRTRVEVAREGRRLAALDVSLLAGGLEVARAAVLVLRQAKVELPRHALPPPPWVPHHEKYPSTDLPSALRGDRDSSPREPQLRGFHTTVEVRRVGGRPGKGRATAWIRIPVPFVLGEETGQLTRLAATSDFGSPLGHIRPSEAVGFINADISLHIHRLPEGEWICLEAEGTAQETGLGLVETRIHDVHGPIGRICQAIMVNRRFEEPGRRS
jgi:acyl-CoA thioesterase